MNSDLSLRNRFKQIAKPAAAILLVTSAFALTNMTGGGLWSLAKPNHAGPPVADEPWLPQDLRHHDRTPTAPEANAGLVLVPIVITLMLLSSRKILRTRSEAK